MERFRDRISSYWKSSVTAKTKVEKKKKPENKKKSIIFSRNIFHSKTEFVVRIFFAPVKTSPRGKLL